MEGTYHGITVIMLGNEHLLPVFHQTTRVVIVGKNVVRICVLGPGY